MTDNVENLILERLKRLQSSIDRMAEEQRELRVRQNETHAAVLGLRRDVTNDAEVTAHVQVQLDNLKDRMVRIETRLELSN